MKYLQLALVVLLLVFSVSAQELAESFPAIETSPDTTTPAYYVIAYTTDDITTRAKAQEQIQETFRDRIEGYIPDHQYIVYASPEELTALVEAGIIEHYVSYYDFVDSTLIPSDTTEYVIHLFASADKDSILQNLQIYPVTVVATTEDTITISDTTALEALSTLEGIAFISGKQKFKAFNDVANTVSGTKIIRKRLGLFGAGQVIGVADTGLDTGKNDNSMHADFAGRIVSIVALGGRQTNPADKDGHGTHVAGSVLGNGVRSQSDPKNHNYSGSYAGAAPEARLVFQAIGDNQGSGSIYPPYPLGNALFLLAYNQGARVHSNSWGSTSSVFFGVYEGWAQEVDKYTNQYKDMTVVFAAGNDGHQGYGTVTPPSLAKNAIAVGGVVTTDPGKLAGFSSLGYTKDGRVKPDVVAPSTSIVSTRSSVGRCSGHRNIAYCILSGTSMATPHVSGILLLLREHYMTQRNVQNPSAALIKATLLNGAKDIGYGIPSKEAGWGRVDISQSLPDSQDNLVFFDERQGLRTGNKKTYTVTVVPGQPFRATLVWTDVKGSIFPITAKKLVNDLDLVVYDPTNKKHASNDRLNNVERVEIKQPIMGTYTIEVHAYNVPLSTQDYALVISRNNALTKQIPLTKVCMVNGRPC